MTRRPLEIAGILVAGAVLLTGCGALGAPTGTPLTPTSERGEPESGPMPGFDDSAGGDSGAEGGDQPEQDADGDRDVIITGEVSMRVPDPIATADAVADAAEARGGSIDRRSEGASTDFEPAWARLTVRVPAEQVEDLLTALRALGDVTAVDTSEQIVTDQVRDLEVRVNAARASVERLTELLATAADTETLLEVEAQLTQRTSELEQLLSQQRSLADQVAMSTIDVGIRATTAAGPTGTPSFWDGLVAGWAAFLAWGAAFLFGLGQSIPALVILALLALLAWFVVRRILRRMPRRAAQPEGTAVANPVAQTTPAPTPDV
ncbi:DUF4349 domain-containing protein [Agrococcus sp. HG114]|uniref:DUF4349 domain-containing protein n=1 Tax=Agrococcus sp. HG114 TaxID=2969757 RepID=UPI00215A2521|nr:DUF4349 domain-containing protein [Agrococcus sp. HG114]MCR8669860.1 DUF4349 domain-containing protein [Agrococcus sp. HG114]